MVTRIDVANLSPHFETPKLFVAHLHRGAHRLCRCGECAEIAETAPFVLFESERVRGVDALDGDALCAIEFVLIGQIGDGGSATLVVELEPQSLSRWRRLYVGVGAGTLELQRARSTVFSFGEPQ